MPFALEQVVPWGRSFDEYRRMFSLTDQELGLRILSCADGPASFNAIGTRRGAKICSSDPLYRFTADQISARIATTYDKIMEQTHANREQFVWDDIQSVEQLGNIRTAAMNEFLLDYPAGKAEGRYVDAELPCLPFLDRSFDLALCSHFLFLYTAQLDERFHIEAIREMCRVAAECRIFPLVALGGTRSAWVDPVSSALSKAGFEVSREQVRYEFQRGGNEMMRVRRPTANEKVA